MTLLSVVNYGQFAYAYQIHKELSANFSKIRSLWIFDPVVSGTSNL
ncbi:hypothetical protein N9K66_08955 [Planktomarina temperata]|nr:hypothetical protein [Planktomarina temperata]MDP4063003.1 hypothetical protein [Rhodobacteraceae bacterium LE17]